MSDWQKTIVYKNKKSKSQENREIKKEMKRQWSELKAEKQIAYEKRVEKRALKNKYMIEKFYEVKDRPRRFPISAKAACKIATNEDLISMGIRKANVKPKAPAEPAGKTLIRKSIELVRHKPLILTSKVEVVANKFEGKKKLSKERIMVSLNPNW